jgi:hypothetical protein
MPDIRCMTLPRHLARVAGIIVCFAGGFSGLETQIAAQAFTSPIILNAGTHLLLDDYLIAQVSNVTRRINCPQRFLKEPVVTAREDKNFQPYMTVLRDPTTQRFRMWYGIPINAGQSHLSHIESEDGIHWIRPHRVLEDPGKIAFGASVLDEGPDFPDPARRYKYVWYNGGMMIARSADGLTWTADPPLPVITGINDILHLARDPARNRYIAIYGYPSQKEDGYKGKTQNSSEGYRRCVGQSTSTNCVNWTPPRRIFAPDNEDEGITEFYSIGGVITRGEMLVGLLKVLRDDLPCDPDGRVDGIGYTVLAWSHDGETWHRDRQPFFDRDHQRGAWDHAMAWMDYQLLVGDEMYFYYGGYARGHKVERFTERQIGLVRITRDRYVAREAQKAGLLRTRLLTIQGNGIRLNVDSSKGTARVRILDANGNPIPGFRFADCTPVTTDALSAPVQWKRQLAELQGRPLRLEVGLENSSLFAIEVTP